MKNQLDYYDVSHTNALGLLLPPKKKPNKNPADIIAAVDNVLSIDDISSGDSIKGRSTANSPNDKSLASY